MRLKISIVKKKAFQGRLIALLVFVLFIGGCIGKKPETDPTGSLENQSVENNESVVLRLEGGDWGYPQPFTHYSRGPGMSKMHLIFDSMLEKDERGYIPWLAESWEVKDEGATYIFKIRSGIKWHDGQELTVEDIAFSFAYYQKYHPVSISQMVLDLDFLYEINILDSSTVELKVAEPSATFLEAAGDVRIIPKHIWEQVTEPGKFTGSESVIGTGPFKLVGYSKEHGTYRYEKNPDFWGNEPAVDFLEFVPVSDSVLSLEKGEIHAATISADLVARFAANSQFTIMDKSAFWGYRIRFNHEKVKDFKNVDVRQAFAYAINQQDIIDKIARGAAIPGSMGILSPQHRWYNPDVPQYAYNTEKALQLLAETKDKNTVLKYELLVGSGREVRIGEILKEQLALVGIELTVVAADNKARDARIAEGNYQLVLVGHGGWGADPDYLRTRFADESGEWYSGTPGYSNNMVNTMSAAQLIETNEIKRKEIIFQLQQLLTEEVPEIPLFLTTEKFVYNNNVYDNWIHVFDHHEPTHNKLSYLKR